MSVSLSLYDPLGIVSPITARVKTIFQMVCKEKADWDTNLSPHITEVWFGFLDALEIVKQLKVDIMDNSNISTKDLGKKGLHQSTKGKQKMAKNTIEY